MIEYIKCNGYVIMLSSHLKTGELCVPTRPLLVVGWTYESNHSRAEDTVNPTFSSAVTIAL